MRFAQLQRGRIQASLDRFFNEQHRMMRGQTGKKLPMPFGARGPALVGMDDQRALHGCAPGLHRSGQSVCPRLMSGLAQSRRVSVLQDDWLDRGHCQVRKRNAIDRKPAAQTGTQS